MNDMNRPASAIETGSAKVDAGNTHSVHGAASVQLTPSAFAASFALALNKGSPTQLSQPANPGALPDKALNFASALSSTVVAHIPLTSQHNGTDKHSTHETALALRAYRQELLASNIANADTPGYKAVDIDLQKALRNGQPATSVPLKYHVPSQGNVDGNTVEMDVERAKFAENALMYEFEVDQVKGHGMMFLELLKNLPY